MSSPDANPIRQLHQVHFAISDLVSKELRTMGVTGTQRRVLDTLSLVRPPGETAAHVAIECFMRQQTVNSVIGTLIEPWHGRGPLVEKHMRPGGTRGALFMLTSDGSDVRLEYNDRIDAVLASVYRHLGPDELETLGRLAGKGLETVEREILLEEFERPD